MYISKVKPLQVCKDYYGRSTSIASYIPNDSVNFCYSRKNILCSSATKIILKVYNDSKTSESHAPPSRTQSANG